MLESKPLPPLAETAVTLAMQHFQATIERARREFLQSAEPIGAQILEVMALSAADGWAVNFDTRQAERTVPDPAP